MIVNAVNDKELFLKFINLIANKQSSAADFRGSMLVFSDEDFTADEKNAISSFNDPAVSKNGLTLSVSVGSLLSDEVELTADQNYDKYVLVSLIFNNSSKNVELGITTQLGSKVDNYEVPEGYSLVGHIKQYKIVANGSELAEV